MVADVVAEDQIVLPHEPLPATELVEDLGDLVDHWHAINDGDQGSDETSDA